LPAVFLAIGSIGPLKIAVAADNHISKGDMTVPITRNSEDELGRMLEAIA
jgi:hypothetical protein